MRNKEKSVARSSVMEIFVDNDFYLLKAHNTSEEPQPLKRAIDCTFIQLHFCIKGNVTFIFNQGNYSLEVPGENSLLLYNTQVDLPLNAILSEKSEMVSVILTIRKFHSLFSSEANYIPFLSTQNKEKKYYAQEGISAAITVVLNQIMNYNLHASVEELFIKGKLFELIALYFNRTEDADIEQCPFLVDEENVRRIREAKEIVIARMAEPPSLAQLSEEIGLPLKKLKEGFKQIYGDSVYSFLFEHKMEYARKMLESGRYNVNEVGLKVGYSTASHFIAAFKKKYGTTPKKYVMAVSGN